MGVWAISKEDAVMEIHLGVLDATIPTVLNIPNVEGTENV